MEGLHPSHEGYESAPLIESFLPLFFSLDQGILIVDESANGSGSIMRPTDEEVDEYYSNLLQNYYVSNYDMKSSEELSVTDIGNYSTIIFSSMSFCSTILPLGLKQKCWACILNSTSIIARPALFFSKVKTTQSR